MPRVLPTLLLISLLATSCSKDDLVSPATDIGSASANPKNAVVLTPPSTDLGQDDPQGLGQSSGPKPNMDDTDGGIDISDDGEDLSDSEKSRKKRR